MAISTHDGWSRFEWDPMGTQNVGGHNIHSYDLEVRVNEQGLLEVQAYGYTGSNRELSNREALPPHEVLDLMDKDWWHSPRSEIATLTQTAIERYIAGPPARDQDEVINSMRAQATSQGAISYLLHNLSDRIADGSPFKNFLPATTAAPSTSAPETASPEPSDNSNTTMAEVMAGDGFSRADVEEALPAAEAILNSEDPAAAYAAFAQSLREGFSTDQAALQKGNLVMLAALYVAHPEGLNGDVSRLESSTFATASAFFSSATFRSITGEPAPAPTTTPTADNSPPTQEELDVSRTALREELQGYLRNNNLDQAAQLVSGIMGISLTADNLRAIITRQSGLMPVSRDLANGQMPEGYQITQGAWDAFPNLANLDDAQFDALVGEIQDGFTDTAARARFRENYTGFLTRMAMSRRPSAPTATAGAETENERTPGTTTPPASALSMVQPPQETPEQRRRREQQAQDPIDWGRFLSDGSYREAKFEDLENNLQLVAGFLRELANNDNPNTPPWLRSLAGTMANLVGTFQQAARPIINTLRSALGSGDVSQQREAPDDNNEITNEHEQAAVLNLQAMIQTLQSNAVDGNVDETAIQNLQQAISLLQTDQSINLGSDFARASAQTLPENISAFAQSINDAFSREGSSQQKVEAVLALVPSAPQQQPAAAPAPGGTTN